MNLPDLRKKRVLVTGGTGFVGGALARRLALLGAEVTALGRDPVRGAALQRDGIAFVPVDNATPGVLPPLVRHQEWVFHCAARSSPWGRHADFVQANVEATRHLLAAARAAGVDRLVHVSTPSLYFSFRDQLAIPETTPPADPQPNAYAATKLAAERLVDAAAAGGQPVITLRPRALFGPGDTTLFPRLLRVASRGRFPLFGQGDPWIDATYVENVVDALLLAAVAPPAFLGKKYNVTNGEPWRRARLLEALFNACMPPPRPRFFTVPRRLALDGARALEMCSHVFTGGRWEPPLTRYTAGVLAYSQTLDITAARNDLNYVPRVDIAEGIRRFAAWRQSSA